MTVATPRKTRTRKVAAPKVTPVKTPKKVTATVRKVKAVKAVKEVEMQLLYPQGK